MEKYWIENIYEMIESYSDLEWQKRAWIDPDDTVVSSYDEDFAMLFDSYCFESFIEEWEKENYDKQVLEELISFRDKLIAYNNKIPNDGNLYDEQMLNDPDWIEVVNQAKKILCVWHIK